MLKKTVLAVAVASSLLAGSAFAADSHLATANKGHFYGAVQLGYGGMNLDSTYSYTQTGLTLNANRSKKNGLAYRLSGGYLFSLDSQWELGPELGYEGYANNDYDLAFSGVATGSGSIQVKGYNIDLLLNTHYHFNNNLFAIAKIGAAYVSEKDSGTVASQVISSTSENKVLPKLSLGLGYEFNAQLSADFTVNSTFGGASRSDVNIDKPDNVRTYLVGVSYHF